MLRWTRNILYAILIGLALFIAIVFFTLDDQASRDAAVLLMIFVIAPLTLLGLFVLARETGIFEPRRRAWLVLGYLEQAVRMNLPLPRLLAAAEATERGATGRQLEYLREQLESGVSISDAVRRAVPLLPARTVALLAASETTGRLGEQLGRVVNENASLSNRDPADDSFLRIYPIIMTAVVFSIVSIIMIFVIPKFEQIFADFRTPVPPQTQWLVSICDNLLYGGWIWAVIAIVLLAPVVWRTKWVQRWQPLASLPRNRNLADICHVIAAALDGALPLPAAIRTAGQLSVGRSMRRKLARWADGIEAGMPSAHAADAAGMPRLISALTATADLTAAAEAFNFLSRYYAMKFSRLITLLRATAIPAMTFLFGGIVGFVVLSLFLPLIGLIDAVEPYRGMP